MQELPKDEKPLNLFLIPSANDRCRNPAYPSFELTMRTLRNLILSYPRNNQPHNHEKSWFANAAKERGFLTESPFCFTRESDFFSRTVIDSLNLIFARWSGSKNLKLKILDRYI